VTFPHTGPARDPVSRAREGLDGRDRRADSAAQLLGVVQRLNDEIRRLDPSPRQHELNCFFAQPLIDGAGGREVRARACARRDDLARRGDRACAIANGFLGLSSRDIPRTLAYPNTLLLVESEFPRAMTEEERAVVDFLLGAEFSGVESLRAQARHAKVTGLCRCGCPTFSLFVDKSLAAQAPTATPGQYVSADAVSTDEPFRLLLFTEQGWLEGVELVWFGEVPPSSFPDLSVFDSAVAQR
jgi:hypothetical protein